MALNAASHNPSTQFNMMWIVVCPTLTCMHCILAGEKTGPISGPPPALSTEATAALLGNSQNDALGQQEGGQDGGDKDEGKKMKSEKERTDPS